MKMKPYCTQNKSIKEIETLNYAQAEESDNGIDFDAPDELLYETQELDMSIQNIANIFTEANELVTKLTSFSDFHDLLTAECYFPSLACSLNDDAKRLADLYDQAQKLCGDNRRAMRY